MGNKGRQGGQSQGGGRGVARAPYNFIPLPDKVVPAQALPDQDCYHADRYSGHFTVTLTTETPLYIRGMLTEAEAAQADKDKMLTETDAAQTNKYKNKPEFFQRHGKPVIPGSSLRGMLRSLVEIVAFGKLTRISRKQLFFRSVDDTAIGRYYRNRMTGNVETGFLREKDGQYFIKVCDMQRVKRSDLLENKDHLYEGRSPNLTPTWDKQRDWYQYRQVWASPDSDYVYTGDSEKPGDDFYPARLVITGNMTNKKREFVFYEPEDSAEEVEVPREMIERFHDDDQITQWQQKAFPIDKPKDNWRYRNGMLRSTPSKLGEPVFFLREEGQLTFFGRAGMFRLPYRKCPADLVPPKLRDPHTIDMAEAIFGFVRVEKQDLESLKNTEIPHQYAGRVFITDAEPIAEQQDWSDWYTVPFTPHILSSPKPTSFQHYLFQDSGVSKDNLRHYDSQSIAIRGHKLYWHRGRKDVQALDKNSNPKGSKLDGTQYTYIKPVKPQKQFVFHIYFENLTAAELGVLLWALKPRGEAGKTYLHKLGMGKPLGMGSVRLTYELQLINRANRYKQLFAPEGDTWEIGEIQPSDEQKFLAEFEKQVPQVRESGRIKALLRMMEWREMDSEQLEYMTLEEFKSRPVLPEVTKVTLTGRR